MTKNEIRRENARKDLVRLDRELKEAGYVYHHSALAKGYYAIDDVRLYEYKGKFGEGYVIESHAENNRFHTVDYYVK